MLKKVPPPPRLFAFTVTLKPKKGDTERPVATVRAKFAWVNHRGDLILGDSMTASEWQRTVAAFASGSWMSFLRAETVDGEA